MKKTVGRIKYMEYNKCISLICYDDIDDLFYGQILGVNDVIVFSAETEKELERKFQKAADGYIATYKDIGKKPEQNSLDSITFSLDPEMYRAAILAAEQDDNSPNKWAEVVVRGSAQAVISLSSHQLPAGAPAARVRGRSGCQTGL